MIVISTFRNYLCFGNVNRSPEVLVECVAPVHFGSPGPRGFFRLEGAMFFTHWNPAWLVFHEFHVRLCHNHVTKVYPLVNVYTTVKKHHFNR